MSRGRTPVRKKRGEAANAAGGAPSATYRVQLNRTFGFRDAKNIIAYLDRLGVSHFYSSPLLKAKSGSLHCYDVVRHDELNPEMGTREEFDSFSRELGRKNLGLVLDIVPNHMSAGDENPLWMSVLEYGPSPSTPATSTSDGPKMGKWSSPSSPMSSPMSWGRRPRGPI